MRVLVLSSETPCYPGSGGQTRQHSLLEPLATSHQIRVLSPGLPAPFGSAPQGVDVRVVPAHPPRLPPRGGWLARNLRHAALASPWLHEFEGHDVDAIKAVLPAELEDFRPEVVQIEHSHLSPLLEALPDGLPTVLVMHNLTFPMTSTLLGARRPRGAHGRLMETALVARAERRAIGRATRVVAVSGHDVWLCQKLQPTAVVREIPNCLPVGYFACYPRQVSADPTLIFTASFFWPPNQEAASLLVRRILPMVRRTHPTARLLLVGRGMPDDLRAVTEATDACTVIGEVADTRPYLASAWVSVVPLFSAGGTQLKVLESLAAGLPVVTTARVAGRMGLGRAEGVVPCDTVDAITAEVCAVLHSQQTCAQLGRNGQRAVADRFDRGIVAPLQEQVWLEAAAVA